MCRHSEHPSDLPWSAIRSPARSRIALFGHVVIVAVILCAFFPALSNELVNWDDLQLLVQNDSYQGLGSTNLRWMFTTTYGGHYQPLSWISYAIDWQFWGLDPFGFHLTNVVLHVAVAIGFFWITRRLTSVALSRSPDEPLVIAAALVATLLFAVHPLRVESVAWATERRDVLSAAWLMATIAAYLRSCAASVAVRRRWLVVSLGCYALALLSKASGMTLPLVLLLLDFYPLKRHAPREGSQPAVSVRALLLEKILFIIPAGVVAMIALGAQSESGALWSLSDHPMTLRVAQAFYGIAFYVWKTLWPAALIPLYEQNPAATPMDWPNIVGATFALLVTCAVWRFRARRPALVIAWWVYLVLLLPVLGIAQSGQQIVADRYSYLACMPWAVLLAGGLAAAFALKRLRALVALGCIAVIVFSISLTRRQVAVWADSYTLWTTTLERAPQTPTAHINLAVVLRSRSEYELACTHSREALAILPGNRSAHLGLAQCSQELNDWATAERHYEIASDISARAGRSRLDAVTGLASLYVRQERWNECETLYRDAIVIEPEETRYQFDLGGLLASNGRFADARKCFEQAIELDPDFTEARIRLAITCEELGDVDAAIRVLDDAIENGDEDFRLLARLGWILATTQNPQHRDGLRALQLTRKAARLASGDPFVTEAMAAAYAETGAYETARDIIDGMLDGPSGTIRKSTRQRLQSQRAVYASGQPLRK